MKKILNLVSVLVAALIYHLFVYDLKIDEEHKWFIWLGLIMLSGILFIYIPKAFSKKKDT